MRFVFFAISFLIALPIATPGAGQSCSTVAVGKSLVRHQVHCDLVKGLTHDDFAFLSGNLRKPYRISANEVSEEAVDSALYLAISVMLGRGVAKDVPAGSKLMSDIATHKSSFDAHDRPGTEFFTGLGFTLNVPIDALHAVLLGAGPGATPQSLDLLDRHFRRVEMSGNHAVLINLIAAINRDVDPAIPAQNRPGYRQLAGLAQRNPEASRLLASWNGEVSDLALQADANRGDRDAIRARAQGVIDGTLEVRTRNVALSILDDAISLQPPFDQEFRQAVLFASARVFQESFEAERFGSRDPRLSHIVMLIELGHTDYGYKLYEWSRGKIDTYLPAAAEGGHLQAQLLLAQAAEAGGKPDDLAEARRWYEMAAMNGNAEAQGKVTAIDRELARVAALEREQAALARTNRAILSRVAGNPDTVKSETWKLTTNAITRPICGQIASHPLIATQVAGQAATIGIKGDVCEYFSILAGKFRIMVRQVQPGTCDTLGCDVRIELGCMTRGAPLLAFCSDFFSGMPQWLDARLLPDGRNPTGFRLEAF